MSPRSPLFPRKRTKTSEGFSGSLVQNHFLVATERRAKDQQELEKRMAEVKAQKAQQLEVRQQKEKQELAGL